MKAWLPTIAFFGFIFLWMTGRIESGLAFAVFGISYAGIMAYMFFKGSTGPQPDRWRRRR